MSNKPSEQIWAIPFDAGDPHGTYCPPKPHMKGGPPNVDAASYTRTDIYDAVVADRDNLRNAINSVLCGDIPRPLGKSIFPDKRPNKNDTCIHNMPMYNDCERCTSEFLAGVLEDSKCPSE